MLGRDNNQSSPAQQALSLDAARPNNHTTLCRHQLLSQDVKQWRDTEKKELGTGRLARPRVLLPLTTHITLQSPTLRVREWNKSWLSPLQQQGRNQETQTPAFAARPLLPQCSRPTACLQLPKCSHKVAYTDIFSPTDIHWYSAHMLTYTGWLTYLYATNDTY